MSDDLIRRSDAIDAICDCVCGEKKHDCDGIGCSYNNALMAIPSVGGDDWIECTPETMPKLRHDTLVTCFIHENWQTLPAYYNGDNWVVFAYGKVWDDLQVIAWRYFPDPFKPKEPTP